MTTARRPRRRYSASAEADPHTPPAHDHVIKRSATPYMTWGAASFYVDRCTICGRCFEREEVVTDKEPR